MDERLRDSLQAQLHRLMEQLDDLNSLRDGPLSVLLRNTGGGEKVPGGDVDDESNVVESEDEYKLMEEETLEQLGAFTEQLERMTREDVKLEDELGAMKMAIRAAIADAFKTPEVIRMFALQQPGQLRERLQAVQRDMKLDGGGGGGGGRDRKKRQQQEVVEILMALRKLGEKLHEEEMDFLRRHKTKKMEDFEQVEDEEGANGTDACECEEHHRRRAIHLLFIEC